MHIIPSFRPKEWHGWKKDLLVPFGSLSSVPCHSVRVSFSICGVSAASTAHQMFNSTPTGAQYFYEASRIIKLKAMTEPHPFISLLNWPPALTVWFLVVLAPPTPEPRLFLLNANQLRTTYIT